MVDHSRAVKEYSGSAADKVSVDQSRKATKLLFKDMLAQFLKGTTLVHFTVVFAFVSQLEPLPHELRPVSVLKMTMDYLATSIMDASNDRWAEWFDFLWNRTRGIRKVCVMLAW